MSGVPPGLVLGPLLFVCYNNGMPEIVSSFIHLYADDTNMFRQINDEPESLAVQNVLDTFFNWADD